MRLECLAVGSLPHKDVNQAMALVKDMQIPFWPQMGTEDMIEQFAPKFDMPEGEFFTSLEQLFEDYEEVNVRGCCPDFSRLENYAVDAIAFEPFLELAKNAEFAKGQITGPFTLAAALTDKNGRCAIYDATLREVIVKTLALKALWQVEKIKAAGAVPIIFIDEPSLSQLGTSAFLTVSRETVVGMIKEVSDIIKENGGRGKWGGSTCDAAVPRAMSAVHCCGKCDWTVIFDTGVDIINLDAYSFAQNLSFCDTATFLERGGKIAWGIVPTLDRAALEKADLPHLIEIFQRDVKYLTEKGIDEKIIIDNSLITPSCGAGALSEGLAQKALRLTCELSAKLKEMYSER